MTGCAGLAVCLGVSFTLTIFSPRAFNRSTVSYTRGKTASSLQTSLAYQLVGGCTILVCTLTLRCSPSLLPFFFICPCAPGRAFFSPSRR